MTEAQAITAILTHWEDNWEDLHPADEDDPDHVPWNPENEVAESTEQWVRITVVPTVSDQASMGPVGSRRWARRGQIAVQVFSHANAGMAEISALADDVRSCLEGARISTPGVDEPVCTYAGSTNIGATDGVWMMVTVVIPYRYDNHR
jgi:hypothetical protein